MRWCLTSIFTFGGVPVQVCGGGARVTHGICSSLSPLRAKRGRHGYRRRGYRPHSSKSHTDQSFAQGCQRGQSALEVKGPRSEKLSTKKKTFHISCPPRTPEQSHCGTWDTSLVGLSYIEHTPTH